MIAVIPQRLWSDLEEYARPFMDVTAEELQHWADEKVYVPITVLFNEHTLFGDYFMRTPFLLYRIPCVFQSVHVLYTYVQSRKW